MTASESKWLAKTSDIVVDQFEGHNGEDLSTTLAALASGDPSDAIPHNVIIVNPDLAETPAADNGKLYKTFAAARAFTNSNAQRNVKHTIILPSGTFSEDVTVDPNLTIIGTNTVLSGGLTSNCTAKDIGVIRNCQVATVTPSSPLSFGSSGTVLTLTDCTVGFLWGFTSSDTPVDPAGKTIYVSNSQVSGGGLCVYDTIYDCCACDFDAPTVGWTSDQYVRKIKVVNSAVSHMKLYRGTNNILDLEVTNSDIAEFKMLGTGRGMASVKLCNCIIDSFNPTYAGAFGSAGDPGLVGCIVKAAHINFLYPVYLSGTEITVVESIAAGGIDLTNNLFAYNHSTVSIADNFNQSAGTYARTCQVTLDVTSYGIPSSVVTTGYIFSRSTLTDVLYADVTTSGSTTTYSNVSQTYTNQTHVGIADLTDGRPAQVPSAGGTIDHPEWYTWVVRSSGGGGDATSVIPRQVIVVNPDIAQADEVEGKLYKTYLGAYSWTQTGNSGANASLPFQILLPSGEVNEPISLKDNLIVTGHNTVISDSVLSYCSEGSTARIEHCYFENDTSSGVYFTIVTDAVNHSKRQLVIESSTFYGGFFDAADAESGKPGHFIIRNSTIHTDNDPRFTVQGNMDVESSYIYSTGYDEYPGKLTLIEATNNASTLQILNSTLKGIMEVSGQWTNDRSTGIKLVGCTLSDGVTLVGYDASTSPMCANMEVTDCSLADVNFSGLTYLLYCSVPLTVTQASYIVPLAGANVNAYHSYLLLGGPASEPNSYGTLYLREGSYCKARGGSPVYVNVYIDKTSYLLGTWQYIAGTITETKHHTVETVTLPNSGWSGTSYTVTDLTGIVYSDTTVVVSPAPSSMIDYCDCSIYCSGQGNGTLTFTYTNHAPTSALTVNVLILD